MVPHREAKLLSKRGVVHPLATPPILLGFYLLEQTKDIRDDPMFDKLTVSQFDDVDRGELDELVGWRYA